MPPLSRPPKPADPPHRRWLTPTVVRLGVVSFLADVSSEMLYPIMPIFITGVLHAPVAVVGLIEGVAEATASLLRTVSGRLSDRSGKRVPYVFAGYSLSAIGKPLIAVAYSWPLVLVARVVDRFGKGLRTSPRDALLADSVGAEYRGRAFGWHRGMDTLGAVVGPLLALVLLWAADGRLRLVLALAFVPGALGALLVLTLRGREHTRVRPDAGKQSHAFRDLPRPLRAYLLAWAPFALANSSDVFLILRARDIGWGTEMVVALYVLYNIVYAIASPVLGARSDRVGRRRVLAGGLVVFAAVYAGFALANARWQMAPLFAVYGLYMAATDGAGKAFAVDLAPPHLRATAVGVLGTVVGVATLVASSVAGLLWTAFGPVATFAYGVAGALLAAALLVTLPSLRHARVSA